MSFSNTRAVTHHTVQDSVIVFHILAQETYQILISQLLTRQVSCYLCYTTTSVVITSNTRKETHTHSRKLIQYVYVSARVLK